MTRAGRMHGERLCVLPVLSPAAGDRGVDLEAYTGRTQGECQGRVRRCAGRMPSECSAVTTELRTGNSEGNAKHERGEGES